jgi:adenylate cyclase
MHDAREEGRRMSSVFLSYDHGDTARAAAIASALEKAGLSVWWDRHIHGGAEFQSEIETAVAESDAVVVLWSKRSIKSAWVRDEAAEGRDQGKLIPVLLEPVKPPMGFRQYQTIDLSDGRRASGPAQLDELLRALAKMTVAPPSAHAIPTMVQKRR